MRQLVLNRIQTPDGTILTSYHRHDYKTHKDKNGETYMIDGGLAYQRYNRCKELHKDLSVYADEPFEKVRESLHWGTRGVGGREPLRFVLLKELSSNHIRAILSTQWQIENWLEALLKQELEHRIPNEGEVLNEI